MLSRASKKALALSSAKQDDNPKPVEESCLTYLSKLNPLKSISNFTFSKEKTNRTQSSYLSKNKETDSIGQSVTSDKCGICLVSFEDVEQCRTTIDCGHQFCEECLILWWRDHESCPYCRAPMTEAKNKKKTLTKEDVPPAPDSDDETWIPKCVFCFADASDNEPRQICNTCRIKFTHDRCIGIKCRIWFCQSCRPSAYDDLNSSQESSDDSDNEQD